MKRIIINAAAFAAVCSGAACAAATPAWPTKPIRVIVPSQAGGGADIVARLIGQKLGDAWGQQIVIDNRIGAVGADIAAKAVPTDTR